VNEWAFGPELPPALYDCRLCPRLVEHREEVARVKRRAYRDETYWGRPVPGFGDLSARIVLLGLAPGAHGANRTGRMFTGDASGDFLYPALHRAGLASSPVSREANDGLVLKDVWITSAARCVPPQNRPRPDELRNCQRWLLHDMSLLGNARVVLSLGAIGHNAYLDFLRGSGIRLVKKHYPFAHGAVHDLSELGGGALPLVNVYHPSFQNTNTGKLTAQMFDEVLELTKRLAGVE